MDTRRMRVVVAVLLLVLAAALWAAREPIEPGDPRADTAQGRADEATGAGPADAVSGDESPGVGSGAPQSPGDAIVPDETLYDLVETLRAADLAPGMNETLTVEYRGDFETIRVRGSFENTSAGEVTLEQRGGTWHVK